MASLAAFPRMLERDRRREGLRVCRAAWLVGVSVREYRELEAGDRMPDPQTYERMCKVFGWPRSFVGAAGDRHAGWGSVNVRPSSGASGFSVRM
jgi:hypothetical protein